jgi:hypothetical protein
MIVAPTAFEDGGGMIGRSTFLALAALSLLGGRAEASEDGLCERLFVPEGYDLDCAVRNDPGQAPWVLTVHPVEGAFAPLSELTIRPLSGPVDDPQAWLREQLTLDLSSFDATLEDLLHGDDSPVADAPIVDQLESWRDLLHQAAGWPRAGGDPPARPGARETRPICGKWVRGPLPPFNARGRGEAGGPHNAVRIPAHYERPKRPQVAVANTL